MDLDLAAYSEQIEEIADQSVKEAKIEKTLESLKDRWEVIDWLMDPYKDTDVPLLKMMDEDFEALEGDQLAVQGMMANRYLAQFEKEVTRWQKDLNNVADVFQYIQDIQRMWSYLEPLFIGSDEVKKELPEDAERFVGIDQSVKDMLQNAWKTKNVRDACNEGGLLEGCEEIMDGLNLCKKGIVDFLDGRRRQFPRYYFVSEADLLDILSNGSDPPTILVHVPKVYLSTKTFELDPVEKTPTDRPIANVIVADVGKEKMLFEPPIPLEGKVEGCGSARRTRFIALSQKACPRRYLSPPRLLGGQPFCAPSRCCPGPRLARYTCRRCWTESKSRSLRH